MREGRPLKMTQNDVISAMKMVKNGWSCREVAKQFNVSHSLIFQLARKAEIDMSQNYDWEAIKLALKEST